MLKAFPFTNYHNWQISALQPFLSHESIERILRLPIGGVHSAHRHGVEDGLLHAVQTELTVAGLRVHRCYGAATQTDGRGRQVEVFSDVSAVHEDHRVSPGTVAPLSPVEHAAVVEYHRGLESPVLLLKRLGDEAAHVGGFAQKLDLVSHGQIVIKPGLQALHMTDGHVTFELVAGAAAGDGADGCVGLATHVLYALGAPEQVRQLPEGQRLVRVDTVAFAVVDYAQEIRADLQFTEIVGQVDDVSGHGSLGQRGLGLL